MARRVFKVRDPLLTSNEHPVLPNTRARRPAVSRHARAPSLTRSASFSSPLSASNTVLGKRRALDDDELDAEHPDPKHIKSCAVLPDELDAMANKENIPPFALTVVLITRILGQSALRRPKTLCRRTSMGNDPGAGAGAILLFISTALMPDDRQRRHVSAQPTASCHRRHSQSALRAMTAHAL
ncbi:hypothetical protein AURDEDRAFT_168146 [Auricularia subglabra TFB-10046 SS5]|nr:hypothetical protein AURDEDRAFT_168146 [Auricularia subglabra TFB-10046 SS5]